MLNFLVLVRLVTGSVAFEAPTTQGRRWLWLWPLALVMCVRVEPCAKEARRKLSSRLVDSWCTLALVDNLVLILRDHPSIETGNHCASYAAEESLLGSFEQTQIRSIRVVSNAQRVEATKPVLPLHIDMDYRVVLCVGNVYL